MITLTAHNQTTSGKAWQPRGHHTEVRIIAEQLTERGAPEMENRLQRIETASNDTRERLVRVETKIENIEKQMLTKGRAAGWAMAIMASVVSSIVGAAWWLMQSYLSPILEQLSKLPG